MPQLTWLGDAEARRAARKVPYRILDPVETIGDPASDNLLIQGDNLEALKAREIQRNLAVYQNGHHQYPVLTYQRYLVRLRSTARKH